MLREAAALLAQATDPAAGAPAQIRPATSTTTIRQPSPRQRGQQHQQHQQQHQGSPGAAGRHVSPPRAGTAAAAAAEASRAAEVTVSASSWWPSMTGPPAGGAAAAVHLTAGPLPDVAPFSWDDVAFVPVLSRDPEGFIVNGNCVPCTWNLCMRYGWFRFIPDRAQFAEPVLSWAHVESIGYYCVGLVNACFLGALPFAPLQVWWPHKRRPSPAPSAVLWHR